MADVVSATTSTDGGSGAGEIWWVPLESNPEVMTKYSRQLGAEAGEWVDVFALDDESLGMVPQPVLAVVLLFPITESYDAFCKEQDEQQAQQEQNSVVPKDLIYIKQFIHNACGTIGVMHALANNIDQVKLKEGSILHNFLESTKDMNPEDRGTKLTNFNAIATVHEEVAAEGQTAPPSQDEPLVTHFVAFVHKEGHLYELDGRRRRMTPINHGPTTADNLLKDAAKVCRARMERDPTEYRFTVVALTTGSFA